MARGLGAAFASLYALIGADTTGLKKGLQESKSMLKDTAKVADKTGLSVKTIFKGIGAGIGITSLGAAAKAMWELGKAGTQLDYTADKFDRLSTSAGTFSELLLTKLRKATKGTRSDAELMAGAGDLMALGLAKTGDEVVRLTRLVGGLGMDMNQLVLTLTNQTTMRFDALGVSVDGFDEKVKKLKASGMDANKAFTEAFLQQAEEQLAKIGDRADTDAGKIAIMEASVKNLADSFKLKLAPAIADASTALDDLLKGRGTSDKQQDQIEAVRSEIEKLAPTYKDYIEMMIDAGIASGKLKDNYRELIPNVMNNAKQLMTLQHVTGAWTEAQWDAKQKSDAMVAGMANAERRGRSWSVALDNAAEKTKKLNDNSDKLTATLESSSNAEFEQSQILNGYVSAAQNAARTTKELNDRIDLYHATISGTMDKDQKEFTQNVEDLRLKTIDLKGQIEKLEKKRYLSKDQKKELQDLRGELETTGEEMTALADTHDEATKRILLNMMEQNLAADGLTKNETALLEQLAEKWGLVDDGTRIAAAAATEAAGIYQGSLSSGVKAATDNVNLFWDAWNALNSLGQVKDFMIRVAMETSERVAAWGGETNPYAPQTTPKKTTPQGSHKAAGGYVSSGVSYPVGEHGVEMFTPATNGYITPNNALGGGDTYLSVTINALPGLDENAIVARMFSMLSRGNSRARAGMGYAGI
jgi:hypothetical protein